jgi:hypothetical protein
MYPTDFYTPESWLEPATARGFVLVVGVLIPLAMLAFFVWSWRKHRRLAAAAADHEAQGAAPLRPGYAVISGRVSEDDANPISVVIEQRGQESQFKGSWTHRWREDRRAVEARPFYVVRRSGERVRVEPDERVFLVDRLENAVFLGNDRRQISARLTAGEPVSVIGTLVRGFDPQQAGYRETQGLVLRPPTRGRLLVSTEPLVDRHRARARLYRNMTIAAASVLLLGNLSVLGFDARCLLGQSVTATVTEARTWKNWVQPKSGKGYWHSRYAVNAIGPDGRRYDEEVSYRSFRTLPAGASLPMLVAGPFVQVGSQATTGFGGPMIVFIVTFSFLFSSPIVLLSTRPWYDRRLVVTAGAGRLWS